MPVGCRTLQLVSSRPERTLRSPRALRCRAWRVLAGCPIYPDNPEQLPRVQRERLLLLPGRDVLPRVRPVDVRHRLDCPDGYTCNSSRRVRLDERRRRTTQASGYVLGRATAPAARRAAPISSATRVTARSPVVRSASVRARPAAPPVRRQLAAGSDAGLPYDASYPDDRTAASPTAAPPLQPAANRTRDCAASGGSALPRRRVRRARDQCFDGTQCAGGDQLRRTARARRRARAATAASRARPATCATRRATARATRRRANRIRASAPAAPCARRITASLRAAAAATAVPRRVRRRARVHPRRLRPEPEAALRVHDRRRRKARARAAACASITSCYIACNPDAGRRVRDRRSVQSVQSGVDVERRLRRVRLELEPRKRVRPDPRQAVREQLRRVHRGYCR